MGTTTFGKQKALRNLLIRKALRVERRRVETPDLYIANVSAFPTELPPQVFLSLYPVIHFIQTIQYHPF